MQNQMISSGLIFNLNNDVWKTQTDQIWQSWMKLLFFLHPKAIICTAKLILDWLIRMKLLTEMLRSLWCLTLTPSLCFIWIAVHAATLAPSAFRAAVDLLKNGWLNRIVWRCWLSPRTKWAHNFEQLARDILIDYTNQLIRLSDWNQNRCKVKANVWLKSNELIN